MRLIQKVLQFLRPSKKEKNVVCDEKQSLPEDLVRLFELETRLRELLQGDVYLARRDYRELLEESQERCKVFEVLQKSGMLESYCEKNGENAKRIQTILGQFQNLESVIEEHNEKFIAVKMVEEKTYLDGILRDVDANILLDEEQRRVVLTDEDYCLVIAGAGAGKSTTIAAKVKYLVEKKQVAAKQILVVSFTNKAVQELRDKIQGNLKIDCTITTFHAAGNSILRRQSEQQRVVDNGMLYRVIWQFFKESVLQDESLIKNLVLFFCSYLDVPYEGNDTEELQRRLRNSRFVTLKGEMGEFEQLRSWEEVEIANFLYRNQIEYEYEPNYPYQMPNSGKVYTPDFLLTQGEKRVYLEHFGITEDGESKRYEAEELQRYRQHIQDKIRFHKEHGTKLCYTFSSYRDKRSREEHLREVLLQEGFELRPRSEKELLEQMFAAKESRYLQRMVLLLCRFISNFKINGYSEEKFDEMARSSKSERNRLFLKICKSCYLEYQKQLTKMQMVDFEDMINESAKILRRVKEVGEHLDLKYIIVDEYQDISRQRFDLTSALSEVCDAKIIAVGDDWQSIYAFSGSDIELFTQFTKKMGYGKELKIVNTYRNAQEVIDIAGNFIQKNDKQIKKMLVSPKHMEDPVIIYSYDASYKKTGEGNQKGANYQMARAVEIALEQIIAFNQEEKKQAYEGNILILGRFGFDGDRLEKSGLFEYIRRGNKLRSVHYPQLKMDFMTAHASKGLGYDNVVVINGKNDTYGFPAKIEDDPVLALVVKEDRSVEYAEERRLFYVAMTRTKNRVFFVAPQQNPSEFLLEIKGEYRNVVLKGDWNAQIPQKQELEKTCPLCGYPLQLRYKKNYGMRMYICTNEPELCGFVSNDLRGGKMSILKCRECRDGYLVVRCGSSQECFLGCTNYRRDGRGCNCKMYQEEYEKRFHTSDKVLTKPVFMKARTPVLPAKKNPHDVSGLYSASGEYQKIKEKVAVFRVGAWEEGEERENEIQAASERVTKQGFFVEQFSVLAAIQSILASVEAVSKKRFFGITVISDLVRGEETEKIRKYALQRLPQFAALRGMRPGTCYEIIQWMLEEHLLLRTQEQYPVLHPTAEGRRFSQTVTEKQLQKLYRRLKKANIELRVEVAEEGEKKNALS